MDDCEVCGKKSDELFLVEIEGAQMIVCGVCAKGKDIIQEYSNRKEEEPRFQRAVAPKDELEIVEGYGRVIREGRDSYGLSTKLLAEKINEKESTLIRVENEHALPDDRLAKKLERELRIKLIVKGSSDKKPYSSSKQNEVTLGDAAIIKDAKKKGN